LDPGIVRVFVEEVRRKPPVVENKAQIAHDPELEVRREAGDPVPGQGPLASIDNLTMLYTRRHLREVANAEAHRVELQDRPFGVVLVELARVADINRLRGYAVGDEEIRTTARTLQTIAVRRQSTACRYSGCRLALVVPDSDEASTGLPATETAEESSRRRANHLLRLASQRHRRRRLARARAGLD
jgi:diguanylate cyclase (GGDEF)-like protein